MSPFKRDANNEEGRQIVPAQKDGDGATPEPSFEGVASNRTFSRREAVGLTGAALAGFAALAATNASPAEAKSAQGKHGNAPVEGITPLESFRLPEGGEISAKEGRAQQIGITSIVGIARNLFSFRENAGTPGRTLEKVVAVNVPAGANHFITIDAVYAAYTTADFTRLTERPLGQLLFDVFLRRNSLGGNELVCRVRLTDSNQDDPIVIHVRAGVVFFRT
jgi:hypothetical protein